MVLKELKETAKKEYMFVTYGPNCTCVKIEYVQKPFKKCYNMAVVRAVTIVHKERAICGRFVSSRT